jgi:hypothetical protein
MSIKEPGHIRKMLLELGLGTGNVQRMDLTQEKANGLHISNPRTGYVGQMSLELKESAE